MKTNVRESMVGKPDQPEIFKQKIALVSGIADRLYRLIEKDEGVPFQLIFGEKPGSGHYLFIGDRIEEISGYDPSVFTEKKLFEMIENMEPLSENIPSDYRLLRELVMLGEILEYRIELCIRTSSGERKWIKETAVRHSEAGLGTGLIGIFHDITEKKNHNILLENAMNKASESERLKYSFLQNISHEVRTPLNAIVGFSALLSEPGLDYGKKTEFAKMLNASTDDLLNIMENIIEISRLETGSEKITTKTVKPSEIILKIHKTFHDKAFEKKISFECCLPSENDFSLNTDGYKLFQILYNLTCNAIKFTSEGRVELGYKLFRDNVEFFVSDTGIGISDQDKPKIFNKFYQADFGTTRRYSGAGLGLTISKAYASMLGGTLNFQSSEGSGTLFSLTLPL